MQVLVTKAFKYSHDGSHIEALEPGDVVDIHDDLAPGLYAGGLIDEASPDDLAKATHTPVEIPVEWRTLHWFKMKKLAETVSAGPVATKAVAIAVLEAAEKSQG